MGKSIGILALCAAIALARQSAAAPPAGTQPTTRASAELLGEIQGKLNEVRSVEADFVQEKHLSVLNHTLTIRGHFAMQKPDRVIWIVRQPVRYAIRVEGDEVQQWDEETHRVQVFHLGGDPTFEAISQQIQAWFLGNYQALAKDYNMEVLSRKPLSLSFAPRARTMVAKILKQIVVTFSANERYIQRMVVTETDGDTTTLTYLHTRINQPIPPAVWRIPPDEH